MKELNIIPRKVWWGLEARSYTEIAQEITASNKSMRRWVAIYAVYHFNFLGRNPGAFHYSFLEDAKNSKYLAIEFEINKNLLEISDGIGANDILIVSCQALETEEGISKFLCEKNFNPELFTPPWGCDYPLD